MSRFRSDLFISDTPQARAVLGKAPGKVIGTIACVVEHTLNAKGELEVGYRAPTCFDYAENFEDRNRDFWGRELWLCAWLVATGNEMPPC